MSRSVIKGSVRVFSNLNDWVRIGSSVINKRHIVAIDFPSDTSPDGDLKKRGFFTTDVTIRTSAHLKKYYIRSDKFDDWFRKNGGTIETIETIVTIKERNEA